MYVYTSLEQYFVLTAWIDETQPADDNLRTWRDGRSEPA
jgi:hypothetical protein